MLRVAFATPGILPMLRRGDGIVYGGSELRAWRFARGLADAGFDVSILGGSENNVPRDLLGPVSIVAAQTPCLEAILSRLIKRGAAALDDAWQTASADIYIAFGAAEYNASLGEWCRANNRPFLLFAGSDADFSEEYRPGNIARNIWGSRCDRCYDSIRLATKLVVQTQKQKQFAKDRFGVDTVVIANPIEIASHPGNAIGSRFLWIGKAVENKRPDLLLALAEACPDQCFVMILNDVGNGLFERISSAKARNVEIVRSVPPSQLGEHFAEARALICTSDFEGFPNTFLDAGRFGVPVLSLKVDPDNIVVREQGGFVARGDFAELARAVKDFAAEPVSAVTAGRRLYDYVKREHEASQRVNELANVLREVATIARLSGGSSH